MPVLLMPPFGLRPPLGTFGVGHIIWTAVLKSMPPSPCIPLPFPSLTLGVGHVLRPTTVSRFGNRESSHADSGVIVAAIALLLRGVGQNEEPLSDVWCPDSRRRKHAPFSSEPHLGQVSEDALAISGSKEAWDILKQRVSGSNLAKHICRCGPHVAGVVGCGLLSGNAEGLAGEARSNQVHKSSVLSSRTGLNELTDIPEYRGFFQKAVLDALRDDGLAVRLPLDVADGAESKELCSKDSAARAGKEAEFIHACPAMWAGARTDDRGWRTVGMGLISPATAGTEKDAAPC